MKVLFEESFAKDLKRIKDRKILNRLSLIIQEVQEATTIAKIRNLRKLKGYDSYFRIKVNNYRIGIDRIDNSIIFVRFLHRKDIYKYFP